MPIFRVKDEIYYFVHIPKCGGTSVEQTFIANGVDLCMLDINFIFRDPPVSNFSSPQHLILEDREILFKESFIDHEFAIVRDPVARFLSAFNHGRRRIGEFVSFERFVDRLERRQATHGDYFGYRYDNHFVPAARFCTDRTEVFHLEDGLDRFFDQMSERLGIQLTADRAHNVRSYEFTESDNTIKRLLKKALFKDSPRAADLGDAMLERIRRLYAEDYARFPRYAEAR